MSIVRLIKHLSSHVFPPCLTGHAIFKLTYLSNHDYKPLYFESDAATVNEIVLKVSSSSQCAFVSLFIVPMYCLNVLVVDLHFVEDCGC